ncbi:MAG TPA: hypothetical protein VGM27_19600 [Acidobacteriaceae bacterium]
MLRHASIFLLFLLCVTALPQRPDRSNPDMLKRFHDDALNITYFYPSRFAPVPFSPTPALTSDTRECVRPTLFANSVTPIDTSSFALSTVDNTCPDVLHFASQLGPFIREKILHQLKQYGQPRILQEPTSYTIDGHAAAIILASVLMPSTSGKVSRTIYAVKACALGSILAKRRKKSKPVGPLGHVVCFDFTTQNSDLLNLMFSFIVQFDDGPLEPMFLGSVLRRSKSAGLD